MAFNAIVQRYLDLPQEIIPVDGKIPQGKYIYKTAGDKLQSMQFLMLHRKKAVRIPLDNKPDPFQKQVPFVSDHTAGWSPVNNGWMRGNHI